MRAGDISCPRPPSGTARLDVPGLVGRPSLALEVDLCDDHMLRLLELMKDAVPLYVLELRPA